MTSPSSTREIVERLLAMATEATAAALSANPLSEIEATLVKYGRQASRDAPAICVAYLEQADALTASMERERELEAALELAIRVADEARDEWDAAPSGMKAGKLLIALSGRLPRYRADIDSIHHVRAKEKQNG